ncbi:hypothetical protein LOTGIDRAFT_229069 [Lottia gigantea]|uniref:TRPM SLOG domain-containing protein n=1 Tax=Lottia gigantea TaxID=225164 RepID=V4BKQ3_LOTGI|nr:hypothetical protein LOTGIDRAFT_229069 [Lottia gigantea]ESO89164.1 hypothetical protein LOTGIDRAFT_229069 [Lottia gigantea]
MYRDQNGARKQTFSVGSDRDLDDIANLNSFSSTQFKNKLKGETPKGAMSHFSSSFTSPGSADPPHHGSKTGDEEPTSSNQPTTHWTIESPTHQKKEQQVMYIESPEHKVSKIPRPTREESTINSAELPSPRNSNSANYNEMELKETDPFNTFIQSGKSGLSRNSSRKKKKHKHKSAENTPDEEYEESKRHKKRKKHKHNQGTEDSFASTDAYTVEDFEKHGYVGDKLPPKPRKKEEDTVSVGSNGTYIVDDLDKESSFKGSINSMFKRARSTMKLTDDQQRNKRPVSKKILSNQKKTASFISKKIFQRECNRYTLDVDSKVGNCQCGRDVEWHIDMGIPVTESQRKEKWSMQTHTDKKACDSFGEITFRGFGHDTTNSPYVRLDPSTNLNDVWDILIEHWGLPVPKLLISVTGGAKKFDLKARLRTVLKQGLIHAAKSTGAWIVTGGTAAGVMEFVGEAVRDHIFSTGNPEQNRVVALGIATWGVINNRLALDGEGANGLFPAVYAVEDTVDQGDGAPLDHNHTHFILVDNGTHGKYGGEIEFRSKLESYISQKVETGVATTQSVHVPCVLLVVEGGINTMKTVLETLRRNTPVVVINGTGRCADLIAYGYKLTKKKNDDEISRKSVEIDEILKEQTRKCLGVSDPEKIRSLVKELNECLHNRRLVNVFSLERADVKEIDRAILYALLKANKSDAHSQLALALAWNRCDIARHEIFTTDNRQKWNPSSLYDAMVTALVQDRTDFVQSFLDNGVDFHKFLTKETLWNIYCLTSNDMMDANGDVMRYMLGYIKQTWLSYFTCRETENFDKSPSLLKNVSKVIVHLLKDSAMDFYHGEEYYVTAREVGMKWLGNTDTLKTLKSRITQQNLTATTKKTKKKKPKDSHDFENPARELFIWAILFNRRSMAHLFWKLGQDQIGAAVVASSLLKAMAEVAEHEEELELSADLNEHAEVYERLATNVLAECYGKDKKMAQQLLIREQTLWGDRTVFQIANNNTLMDFLEHSCCQTKLNTIWKGAMALYTSEPKICLCILFPVLLPFIKFSTHKSLEDIIDDDDDDDDEEEEAEAENTESKDSNRPPPGNKVVPAETDKKKGFTPAKSRRKKDLVKKKMYGVDYFKCDRNNVNILSALVFFYSAPVTKFYTGLVAYLVFLGVFTYFVLVDLRPVIEENSPSLLEYITWVWLGTMVIEELRQIIVLDQPPIYKLRNWFESVWNRFDLAMYMLFLISVVLRYTIFNTDFLWARISYSITLAMFYLRLMQSFFISKNMGPKVIMIEKMLTDLFFFFLILLVFIMSFGIAYQANLYPNSPSSWVILKNILYLPYWQMYGELFLERVEGEEEGCTYNETIWREDLSQRCPETNAFVPVLLAIYMILTNILLVNLLIAMFSYTFQTIQDNSLKVWRFYRLSLVQELFDRPTLVPPLVIINHIYRLFKLMVNKTCGDFQKKDDFCEKLTREENLRLSLFERGAMENYLSHSLMKERELLDNKVTTTAERSSQGADEVSYLRHCIDDLSEQMGNNNFRMTQMMKMMEDLMKKQNVKQSLDLKLEDYTHA